MQFKNLSRTVALKMREQQFSETLKLMMRLNSLLLFFTGINFLSTPCLKKAAPLVFFE